MSQQPLPRGPRPAEVTAKEWAQDIAAEEARLSQPKPAPLSATKPNRPPIEEARSLVNQHLYAVEDGNCLKADGIEERLLSFTVPVLDYIAQLENELDQQSTRADVAESKRADWESLAGYRTKQRDEANARAEEERERAERWQRAAEVWKETEAINSRALQARIAQLEAVFADPEALYPNILRCLTTEQSRSLGLRLLGEEGRTIRQLESERDAFKDSWGDFVVIGETLRGQDAVKPYKELSSELRAEIVKATDKARDLAFSLLAQVEAKGEKDTP